MLGRALGGREGRNVARAGARAREEADRGWTSAGAAMAIHAAATRAVVAGIARVSQTRRFGFERGRMTVRVKHTVVIARNPGGRKRGGGAK